VGDRSAITTYGGRFWWPTRLSALAALSNTVRKNQGKEELRPFPHDTLNTRGVDMAHPSFFQMHHRPLRIRAVFAALAERSFYIPSLIIPQNCNQKQQKLFPKLFLPQCGSFTETFTDLNYESVRGESFGRYFCV
jgi:hypothetical protein